MVTTSNIIVLRVVSYSESSQIATVYSEEHGKIAIIAKGARKPKSPYAGLLQPGHLLTAIYYYKPTRSVQTLSRLEFETRARTLYIDIEKTALVMGLMELTSQVLQDGEVNHPVFQFVRRVLIWLDLQEEVSRLLFPYLQVRLLDLLGLGLQPMQGGPDSVPKYLNVESGTVGSGREAESSRSLSRLQGEYLQRVLCTRSSAILAANLPASELRQLIEHLDHYFRYHLEGIRPRRSDAIFDQILQDPVENP
ncbi:MAG: DNA repair protein RecO [Balneolaceae bacterium]